MPALNTLLEEKRNELKKRFCYDNMEQMEGFQVYNRIMDCIKPNIETLAKEIPGLMGMIEILEDHRSALVKAHFKTVIIYNLALTGVDCFVTDDFINELAKLETANTKIVTLGFFIEAELQRVAASKKLKSIIDPDFINEFIKNGKKIGNDTTKTKNIDV